MNQHTAPIYVPGPGREFVLHPIETDYIVAFIDKDSGAHYACVLRLVRPADDNGPDEHGKTDFVSHLFGLFEVEESGEPGKPIRDMAVAEKVVKNNLPHINSLINRYIRETPLNVKQMHEAAGIMEMAIAKMRSEK